MSIASSRSTCSHLTGPRRHRKSRDTTGSDDITQEVFVDFSMSDSIAEYWMREFAKKQYLAKCMAVGVVADHDHSPRQVLINTEIMIDTWNYWREEPNCTGVDFWIGTRDKEIHAYPRFIMTSHVGSHPRTR